MLSQSVQPVVCPSGPQQLPPRQTPDVQVSPVLMPGNALLHVSPFAFFGLHCDRCEFES
jgi:hypothetical protein